MNKIAQRRGILNKIREKINAPGEAVAGTFSPEFARLMDTLREVDDEAREHAADLKDMLKVARSNFNRREYMSSISNLGKFHERLELVRWQFTKLSDEVNMVHNEFLFGDLDDEHKRNLFETMPERHKAKPKAEPKKKEAGIKDWWSNLTNDDGGRGKALKFWEKRFPKAAKEIKRQTEKMINRSEMFLNVLLSTFKNLATLRATRNLEEYIKVSTGFVQKYNSYDNSFNEYFNNSVKPFIESQKKFETMKAERDAVTKEQAERPMNEKEEAEELLSPPSAPGASTESAGPDSGDRPTGTFNKAPEGPGGGPGSSGGGVSEEAPLSDIERELKEEIEGGPVSGWPQRSEQPTGQKSERGPSTYYPRDSEVISDRTPSTYYPRDSEVISDRPSSHRAIPVSSPAVSSRVPSTTHPNTAIDMEEDTTNYARPLPGLPPAPSVAPLTPTMRSPVPQSGVRPTSIYTQPIPKSAPVPSFPATLPPSAPVTMPPSMPNTLKSPQTIPGVAPEYKPDTISPRTAADSDPGLRTNLDLIEDEIRGSFKKDVSPEMNSDLSTNLEPGFDSEFPGNVYEQEIPRSGRVPDVDTMSDEIDPVKLKTLYWAPDAKFSPDAPVTVAPSKRKTISEITASNFIARLSNMSNENPLVFAKEIIVFANSIASSDKVTSERLLKIAKQLIKQ